MCISHRYLSGVWLMLTYDHDDIFMNEFDWSMHVLGHMTTVMMSLSNRNII